MDLTTRSQAAISKAVASAAERGNPTVEPAHLGVALLDDREGLARALLGALGVDAGVLASELQAIADRLPAASGSSVAAPQTSRALLSVLTAAEREARSLGDEFVSTEHLLLGLAAGDGDVADSLSRHSATTVALTQALTQVRGSRRVTTADPEGTFQALEK